MMATAAAELFVKVSADIAGLSKGFNAAAQAAKGLGETIDGTAAAFNMLKTADASLERTKLAASLLGKAFDETGESIKLTEIAIAKMVMAGLKPGNAALDAATAKLRALQETAAAAAPRIDQTAKGFDIIAKNSEGFDTARMRAKLLGTAFDDTAERVKFAQKSVSDLINLGLKPGDAAMDRAIVKLRQAQKAHEDTAAATTNHEHKANLFGKALAGLSFAAAGAGLAAMAKHAVTLASELEQNRIAFTTMLGSAEKADTLLRDLASFAASTPFELRGLVDSSKRLMAFGFDAKAIIPVMEGVGNAVAAVGGGKETLDGVTLALGQMAAKGKVSAEEMNQLAERGIPAWKMLSDAIGVSVPEAMKRAEKGSIDAGTAITALINGMNEKFPGMMQKQSQTFAGALSNLQDSADAALTKIGTKIIEVFKLTDIVRGLSDAITGVTNAITTGGLLSALDKAFGPATKAAILGLGVAMTGALLPAIAAAAPAIGAIALAWAPAILAAGKFIAAGVAVAALAYPIIKNWDGIKGTITALFDTAATYAAAWYNRAVRVFNDFASMAGKALRYVNNAIRDTFGIDIAAKLGVGIAKAGGYVRKFSKMAVNGLGIVTDSVRYATQNFAADFTVGFNQGAAAVRSATGKITADMLGLARATQAAGAAAKETAGHKRELARALQETTEQQRGLVGAIAGIFALYQRQASAARALAVSLAEVDQQALQQGRSFDVAGARAKAYSDNLKAIQTAFGSMSPQAQAARAAIEQFTQASANGGAATAAAYGVIDDATRSLEAQAFAAKALGKDYDVLGEQIKSAEAVLTSLIEKGLRPGNSAYDEAAKRLEDVRKGLGKKIASIDDLTKGMGDLFGQTNSLLGQLKTLTDAFGLEGASAAIQFAQAAIQVGSALAEIPGIIAGIGSALTSLSALFVTNPILAAILAIVGVVAIAAGAMYAWWQSTQEESRKAAEEMRKVEEEAKRIRQTLESSIASGIKSAAKEFLNGTKSWEEALRSSMRNGLIDGILDALVSQSLVASLADLFENVKKYASDPMSQAFKDATKALGDTLTSELKRLGPALDAVKSVVGDILPQATAKVESDTAKVRAAAERTTVDAGMANRIKTIESGQRHYLDELTRLTNAGLKGTAEYARVLARANESSKWIRDLKAGKDIPATFADSMTRSLAVLPGMATGGLVTGPTMARLGEGGRNEAVLPLNDSVYRQLGEGIAAARGGGTGTQVVVQYYGNGKWTREDAQGLGRLLVSELRTMGVRA